MEGGSVGDWNRGERSSAGSRHGSLAWCSRCGSGRRSDERLFHDHPPGVRGFGEAIVRAGYKILLDLFASSSRPLRFAEIPYTFRGSGQAAEASWMRWLLRIHDADPRQAHRAYHPGTLRHVRFRRRSLGCSYFGPVAASPCCRRAVRTLADSSNIYSNDVQLLCDDNVLTYRDRRLKGIRLLTGSVVHRGVLHRGLLRTSA